MNTKKSMCGKNILDLLRLALFRTFPFRNTQHAARNTSKIGFVSSD